MSPAVVVAIQIALALTLAPLVNTIPALGEELGWRGFLLPRLLPVGQVRAILMSSVIWGVWHAPVILQGHNYPSQPVLGVFLMVAFCVLSGTILSWLYLWTRSPWAPALGHATINATGGLSLLFVRDVDLVLGGTTASLIGWIPLAAIVAWLVLTHRLPVTETEAAIPAAPPEEREAA
jgi:membrane protease YdiL (CAAX protease family)